MQDLRKIPLPKAKFKVNSFKLNKSTLTDTKAIYEPLMVYDLD